MSATRGSWVAVSLRMASMRTSGSSSASGSTLAGSSAAQAGATKSARANARRRRGWNMDFRERRSGRPPFQGKAPAPVLQDQTGVSGFFSLPAMNGLHGWARMGPLVRHTTLNCPSARTSPMSTGLCRWWFFSSIFSL